MPLPPFTPDLQLHTLFELNTDGRIVCTREPNPAAGPLFALVRNQTECAWAVHRDVPENLADQLDTLARTEPPAREFEDEPVHATRYQALVGGRIDAGPVFAFPDDIPTRGETILITDLSQLERHFRGWTADEIPRRGFGGRVTAAWARAIQTSGSLPIYSTSWSNTASLAVARNLGLTSCACDWSLT